MAGNATAFLRFSRDKRGYEHFYLIQPPGRGKGRPRVLYWFRTPPNVKVGRAPFDSAIQRALESSNPDVAFDWTSISQTPIPPPSEGQRWKERRRVERAMRDAAEAEEAEAIPEVAEGPRDAVAVLLSTEPRPLLEQSGVTPNTAGEGSPAAASDATSKVADTRSGPPAAEPEPRRRRRRRRRRGGGTPATSPEGGTERADPGTGEPEEGV